MNELEKNNKYELIRFEDGDFTLDVNVSPNEETVWLTQEQISSLFQKSRSTITEHINNIFSNKELDENTSVGISDKSDNHRPAKLYNLDVILAVGYRVNSKRGILFRKWANSILKQYLLNGYVLNHDRIVAYQDNILNLEANYLKIENRITNLEKTIYTENNIIFFEGEIIKPYSFLMKLFFIARERIVIIDNYADEFLLSMLEKIDVPIRIYTTSSSYLNRCKLKDNIKVIKTEVFHDRYIIIDTTTYSIGTSINNIGKKRFTISKLDDISFEMLIMNLKNGAK